MELKPLFFIIILVALLLTPGCLEGNNTISPPFGEGQFYSKVTDLNYTDLKAGDYNNMVLVFDGNKLTGIDVNSLDINFPNPDLNAYLPRENDYNSSYGITYCDTNAGSMVMGYTEGYSC